MKPFWKISSIPEGMTETIKIQKFWGKKQKKADDKFDPNGIYFDYDIMVNGVECKWTASPKAHDKIKDLGTTVQIKHIDGKTYDYFTPTGLPKGLNSSDMPWDVKEERHEAPKIQDREDRILRSQSLNIAATIGAKTPLDILKLAKDVYTEVKGWINE